jgi:hypothetical protein
MITKKTEQVQKNKMDLACSTRGVEETCSKIMVEDLQ